MWSLLPSLLHFYDCDSSGHEAIFPYLILLHSMFFNQQLAPVHVAFICSLQVILLKHGLHKQPPVVKTRNAIRIPLAASFNDTHFWGLFSFY